jgi:hypothetical protein
MTVAKTGYEWSKTLTWDRTAAQVEETMLNAVRKKKALPQPAAPHEFIWEEPKSDVVGPGGENVSLIESK